MATAATTTRTASPRHGGYYLVDWAVAYRAEQREDTFRHLSRMADYW